MDTSSSGDDTLEESLICEGCGESSECGEMVTSPCGCILHEECQDESPRYRGNVSECPACCAPVCSTCHDLYAEIQDLKSKLAAAQKKIDELSK